MCIQTVVMVTRALRLSTSILDNAECANLDICKAYLV